MLYIFCISLYILSLLLFKITLIFNKDKAKKEKRKKAVQKFSALLKIKENFEWDNFS